MTYIEYLNEFNQWLESNALPGNAQLMYFKLLNVFNKAGWPEYVQVDSLRLMLMVDCKKDAAYRAREKLKEAGFISYKRGKKGAPTLYFLSDKTTENATENATHIKTKTKTKTKNIPPCIPPDDFSPALSAAFANWLQYKREKRQDYKPTGLQSLAAQVRKAAETYGEQAVIDLIGECMANNWQGIIFDRLERGAARNPSGKNGGNIFMDMLREESESGAQ